MFIFSVGQRGQMSEVGSSWCSLVCDYDSRVEQHDSHEPVREREGLLRKESFSKR
jgi:hypothetical protein